MAGYKYYTILTDIGKEKLVEAIANETALDFTEMAVGDSNGTSYNPTPDMTALKHETYRATISSVSIDEVDKNIMIFEMVVPASSGGYYIREAGLFSSDGSLIAIARTAEQYKPLLEEGAGASITISMRIAISSDVQVYINIPESINYATQTYVAEEFEKHKAEENPHTQYVLVETYSEKITELEKSLAGKAEGTHNHDGVYSSANHNHDEVYAKLDHTHDVFDEIKDLSSNTIVSKDGGSASFATVLVADGDGSNIRRVSSSKLSGDTNNRLDFYMAGHGASSTIKQLPLVGAFLDYCKGNGSAYDLPAGNFVIMTIKPESMSNGAQLAIGIDDGSLRVRTIKYGSGAVHGAWNVK